MNKAALLLGDQHENYKAYNRLKEFSSFVLVRMTLKLDNFQVHRQVETNYTQGPNSGWLEDKITFTDPLIYFYRERFGRGPPGALGPGAADHSFKEISRKKCIRSCKDGWYWTTTWPTKTEREMVDTTVLSNMMDGTQALAAISKNQFLNMMGAKSKQDDGGFDDQHDCKFWIGRDAPYPKDWFTNHQSKIVGSVERFCSDYVSYTMTSYVTVRAFRKRL